ncbi:MAG: hypothetical protein QW540_08730 [Archaeoglobaceae archaeon]
MDKEQHDETIKEFVGDFIELIKGRIDDQTFYEKWELVDTKEKKKRGRKSRKSKTESELEQRLRKIESLLQEIMLYVGELKTKTN